MSKHKPCNLTKAEWKLFINVLQYYYDNNDLTEKEDKQLEEIHMKVFFMDNLVKDME